MFLRGRGLRTARYWPLPRAVPQARRAPGAPAGAPPRPPAPGAPPRPPPVRRARLQRRRWQRVCDELRAESGIPAGTCAPRTAKMMNCRLLCM